jgi:single-strand DNA-binding protein
MLKMQIIGHLGKDCVMQQHGTDNVINFSVAHTDKYKEGGVLKEKTTWVECSWWVDSQSKVAQFLRKGTQVYIDGFPGSKYWESKDGKKVSQLTIRVLNLQLLGGRPEGNGGQAAPAPSQQQAPAKQDGYVPFDGGADSDLPF